MFKVCGYDDVIVRRHDYRRLTRWRLSLLQALIPIQAHPHVFGNPRRRVGKLATLQPLRIQYIARAFSPIYNIDHTIYVAAHFIRVWCSVDTQKLPTCVWTPVRIHGSLLWRQAVSDQLTRCLLPMTMTMTVVS